jgi:hypothetical protein
MEVTVIVLMPENSQVSKKDSYKNSNMSNYLLKDIERLFPLPLHPWIRKVFGNAVLRTQTRSALHVLSTERLKAYHLQNHPELHDVIGGHPGQSL